MQEELISDYNRKFSPEEFQKRKPAQKAALKNELKNVMANLKSRYGIKVLDDDYLFAMAARKANFTMMQQVNEYREIATKKKNTKNDQKQTAALTLQQDAARRKLLESLFGAYSLFNLVDEKTIAVNPDILQKMMA